MREEGLSPRGRGNQSIKALPSVLDRSIPAWAGEPDLAVAQYSRFKVYPRVGGGTAKRIAETQLDTGLSPRGRGNPHTGTPRRPLIRSIPAWAGEP